MNKLHPKIEGFYNTILNLKAEKILSHEVLQLLHDKEATATEVSCVLHMGFDIDVDEAYMFAISSKLFPREEINEIVYQTFLYFYYGAD